jgi:hypothetical protein
VCVSVSVRVQVCMCLRMRASLSVLRVCVVFCLLAWHVAFACASCTRHSLFKSESTPDFETEDESAQHLLELETLRRRASVRARVCDVEACVSACVHRCARGCVAAYCRRACTPMLGDAVRCAAVLLPCDGVAARIVQCRPGAAESSWSRG